MERNGLLSKPKVVGIDPSIRSTGVCYGYDDCSAITFSKDEVEWDGESRIRDIAYVIYHTVCYRDQPDLVVIEDLVNAGKYAGNSLVNGMVQGAIRYILMEGGVPYLVVPPTVLKKFATGKGNVDKTEMALAAFKRSSLEFDTSDECDAWWLRQFGLAWVSPDYLEVALPKSQVDLVSKGRLVGEW